MMRRALSDEEAEEIRLKYRPGTKDRGLESLADEYGVSTYTIHKAIHKIGSYGRPASDDASRRRPYGEIRGRPTMDCKIGARLTLTPHEITYIDLTVDDGATARIRLTRTDARRLAISLLTMGEGE